MCSLNTGLHPKHNSFYYLCLILLSSIILSSCIDVIDLNIDDLGTTNNFVVVEGFISDKLEEHSIRIYTSATIGIGNDNIFTDIENASVEVKDDQGNSVLFYEVADEPGVYSGVMQAKPNVNYEIFIQLSTGEIIRSTEQKLNPAIPIDSITYAIRSVEEINRSGNLIVQDYVYIYVNSTIEDSEKKFIRWRSKGVYQFKELSAKANPITCYITNSIDNNIANVFNANDLSGNTLNNQFILRTPIDDRFHSLYCFHIEQILINEEEYNFWKNAKNLIELEGSLFDPPPGKIMSNLYSEQESDKTILGYFSVYSSVEKRIFISPSQIGYTPQALCVNFSELSFGDRCLDCTRIFGSTSESQIIGHSDFNYSFDF